MVLLDVGENEKKPPLTGKKRWFRFAFRTSLVLAIIFAVSLFVLSLLGGSHEALKLGMQDYLRETSGMEPDIGAFEHMGFYPDLRLEAGDISLRSGSEKASSVTIGHALFATGFWDQFFSRGRIAGLDLSDIWIGSDVLGTQAIAIKRMALDEKGYEDKPAFVVEGTYGEGPLHFHAMMDMKTKKSGKSYFKLPESTHFVAQLASFQMEGEISRAKGGGLQINLSRVGSSENPENPENNVTGQVILKKNGASLFVESDLQWEKSHFHAALKNKNRNLDGDIEWSVFDFSDWGAVMSLVSEFKTLLPDSDEEPVLISLKNRTIDLNIAVGELRSAETNLGNLSFPVHLEEGVLIVGPLGGMLSGGELSGKMELKAVAFPASMTLKAGLKNWEYGQIQKAFYGRDKVSGTANINISLSATGKTTDDLLQTLKGEAVLLAGKGEFNSAVFDLWSRGLVNALLPDLDSESETTLNCMIADFKVEDGIARPDPLFLDTTRVTVSGAGDVNIPEGTINLKLTPKAKETALLDVATAVRITGPVLDPSIGPDLMSLGKTLGGALLGVVNPAFLAFSMTDLGLTEDHPCHDFIKKAEVATDSP